MSTHRDPDPYGWLSDRPRPIWQRVNWWRVVPLVASAALVLGMVTACSVTFLGGGNG